MSYSTFEPYVKTVVAKEITLRHVLGLLALMLSFLALNIWGFVIGVHNVTSQCYETQNIISLGLWLIISCSVAMISNACMILICKCILLKMCMGSEDKTIKMSETATCVSAIAYCIFGIFGIIMTIIGIVELAYQYEACRFEVPYVCTIIIVIVTVNMCSFVFGCGISCVCKWG